MGTYVVIIQRSDGTDSPYTFNANDWDHAVAAIAVHMVAHGAGGKVISLTEILNPA